MKRLDLSISTEYRRGKGWEVLYSVSQKDMEQLVTHFPVGFAISSEVEQSSLKRYSIGSTPILNIIRKCKDVTGSTRKWPNSGRFT